MHILRIAVEIYFVLAALATLPFLALGVVRWHHELRRIKRELDEL
jgi:hypothetical protein